MRRRRTRVCKVGECALEDVCGGAWSWRGENGGVWVSGCVEELGGNVAGEQGHFGMGY